MDSDDLKIFALMAAVVVAILATAWLATEPHRRELREHGCQLIHESETGRRTGKGHHEVVRVYECADGMRTELD